MVQTNSGDGLTVINQPLALVPRIDLVPEFAATPPQPTPPQNPQGPDSVTIRLSFGLEGIVILIAAGYLIYERLLRPTVIDRLLGTFQPIEEQRKLNELMAQIGAVTTANRVLLWTFHNGELSTSIGYHYAKATVTNAYFSDHGERVSPAMRNVPFGVLYTELKPLLENPNSTQMIDIELVEAEPCKEYLRRTNTTLMFNRLVKIGNLPLAVISLQFCSHLTLDEKISIMQSCLSDGPSAKLVNKLVQDVRDIMKVRAVRPSRIAALRAWMIKRVGTPPPMIDP